MKQRRRRVSVYITFLLLTIAYVVYSLPSDTENGRQPISHTDSAQTALSALDGLIVKGRSAKTDYDRTQFGDGWQTVQGCDMRNRILARDLQNIRVADDGCKVEAGELDDPYTAQRLIFSRGATTSQLVQIDHVVALADAWQKGASYWTLAERLAFANDPLELLAVDGEANQQKGSGDAATWLPSNKPFRCQYVARQIAIKLKYDIWVTTAEKSSMGRVLSGCPDQRLPSGL